MSSNPSILSLQQCPYSFQNLNLIIILPKILLIKINSFYLFDKIRCNIFIVVMRKTFLGEFEEIVLLSVAVLDDEAYGVSVTIEIEKQTGRSVGFNSVHTTLQRLEEKGFLTSKMGGATAERGGRRKRFFRLTAAGGLALKEVRDIRTQLWESLPKKAMYLS